MSQAILSASAWIPDEPTSEGDEPAPVWTVSAEVSVTDVDGKPIAGLSTKSLWTLHLTFANKFTMPVQSGYFKVEKVAWFGWTGPGFYMLALDPLGGVGEWGVPTACGIALHRKAATKPRPISELQGQIVVPVAWASPRVVATAWGHP
jgi:hypothetical protein